MTIKTIFVLIFLAQPLLLTTPCYSESVNSLSNYISTPEELAVWLSRNLTYEFVFGGKRAQTLQEFLDSKKGNCEDFANLASEILKRMGIKNKVIILKLKGSPADHAACIWKNNDGTYSFISNEELYKTKETIVADAIAKFFPECYKISDYSDARIAWR
ncbi:MAG: hypothetical protein NT079_00090 [Candidatus Omnitrophica bacterium]|nr:hypothetical protein [Candidatus Omnitrophota bacterium]